MSVLSNSSAIMPSLDPDNVTVTPSSALSNFETWLSFGTLFSLAVVGTIFLTLFIVVIARDRKTFGSPFYDYLVCICVEEIISLHYYGSYGGACIVLGACPVPLGVDRVVSSISWIVWFIEYISDAVIAVDRLVAICFAKYYDRLSTRGVVGALSATIWLAPIAWAMPLIVSVIPCEYIVAELSPDYSNRTLDATQKFIAVEHYIEYVVYIVVAVVYGACIGFLFWRRKQHLGGTSVGVRRAQRNLLIQSFLRIAFMVSYVVLQQTIFYSGFWPVYASAVILQMIPINTIVVTLAVNSAIREGLWKLLHCRKAHAQPLSYLSSRRGTIFDVADNGRRGTVIVHIPLRAMSVAPVGPAAALA